MKHILFITGILFTILLYIPQEEVSISNTVTSESGTVTKEKNTKDMQHRLEKISKDLKNSKALTSRRNVQTTNYTSHLSRIQRNAVRILQDIRLKGDDKLQKVSEYVSYCQTLNYSSLLCRMGYHVYALRKIVI